MMKRISKGTQPELKPAKTLVRSSADRIDAKYGRNFDEGASAEAQLERWRSQNLNDRFETEWSRVRTALNQLLADSNSFAKEFLMKYRSVQPFNLGKLTRALSKCGDEHTRKTLEWYLQVALMQQRSLRLDQAGLLSEFHLSPLGTRIEIRIENGELLPGGDRRVGDEEGLYEHAENPNLPVPKQFEGLESGGEFRFASVKDGDEFSQLAQLLHMITGPKITSIIDYEHESVHTIITVIGPGCDTRQWAKAQHVITQLQKDLYGQGKRGPRPDPTRAKRLHKLAQAHSKRGGKFTEHLREPLSGPEVFSLQSAVSQEKKKARLKRHKGKVDL